MSWKKNSQIKNIVMVLKLASFSLSKTNLGVKYDMEVSPSDSLIKQQSVSELVCEELV